MENYKANTCDNTKLLSSNSKVNSSLINQKINNKTQNTSSYSRTKAVKIYVENANKIIKEENENIKGV